MMSRLAAVFVTCVLAAAAVDAMENTEANRLMEANRYLEATPPEEMVSEMAKNMSKNLPEEKRQELIDVITKHLDLVRLRKAMVDAIVKHFTADELKALADFYGSPVGKSAMSKFGPYMAEVMPSIQTNVMKALADFMEKK